MPSPVVAQTALAVQRVYPMRDELLARAVTRSLSRELVGCRTFETRPLLSRFVPPSQGEVSFSHSRPSLSTTWTSSAIFPITTEDYQSAAVGANIDPEKQAILEADTALAAEAACGSHDQVKFSPITSSSISG